MQIVYADTMH